MEPLTQPDYVDGKIGRLTTEGGEVHLEENGTTYHCTVGAEVAGRLRPFLNGPTVRVYGTAVWLRHPEGRWELQAFSIESFTPLDDRPLDQVLQ